MTPAKWLSETSLPPVRRAILAWYDRNARQMPWRDTTDPYRIMVSEIMLQQTLVNTVRRYYERFLDRFPTVHHLAAARESDVLHVWQGLGYYRRALNLRQAACRIVEEHGGEVPDAVELLRKLPGLGQYAANAIACFAFHQKRPIIEANTRRLWTRVCAADGDPAREPLNGELWRLAEQLLPRTRFRDFNQAVMDLGSQICLSRGPNCPRCPLRAVCRAHADEAVHRFPGRAKPVNTIDVDHVCVVIWRPGERRGGPRVLVRQLPKTGLWAGLWEFPRVERHPRESWESAALRAARESRCGTILLGSQLLSVRHSVLHFRVQLRCFQGFRREGTQRSTVARGRRWVRLSELAGLAFPSPQRRIVQWLLDHCAKSGAASAKPMQSLRAI